MKHIVTINHQVEAESWDLAVEAVLRAPISYLAACQVKPFGKRAVHVSLGSIAQALDKIAGESVPPGLGEPRASEPRFLVVPAEGDIDEDDGLTLRELARDIAWDLGYRLVPRHEPT